ncbi:MAG: RadC family protein [Candidatus Woesearchaeota archaeon]
MKIKELALQLRPRERMLKNGAGKLNDAELFAILLGKGTKNNNIIDISNNLISNNSYNQLANLSINELTKFKGIGQIKALQIKAIFELCKRINLNTEKIINLNSPKKVFLYMKDALKNLNQEHFFVLCLNSKNCLVSQKIVSIGTINSTIIHPREIFRDAIKNSACSIIIVHNHPSGCSKPSNEDLEITKNIIDASKLISIQILDHIIIGNNNYWSYKENYNI